MGNGIPENINIEDTWIDVDTLAKLKNITKRAVRLSLNQNKYEYKVEKIRGGKTYRIKLSSLEEEYQLKYINEYYDDFKFIDNEIIELKNVRIKQEKLITETQKTMALAKYDDFGFYGFNILAMFDNDPLKVDLTVNGKQVFHISKLPDLTRRLEVEIAVLTVPRQFAQDTADFLVSSGIRYIWNFRNSR